MKHKKILLTLLIFTFLVITLSLTVFAKPNLDGLDFNMFNSCAITVIEGYANVPWLTMIDIYTNDITSYISIFSVDSNALYNILFCDEFVNQSSSACSYLRVDEIGSLSMFYNSENYFTNLDEIYSQINFVGRCVRSDYSYMRVSKENFLLQEEKSQLQEEKSQLQEENSLLQENANTLSLENQSLSNQLISLNEGFYMLQQNYNTLADENVILKQTVENLKSSVGDGYTAAIDVMRMWFNDRGYSYELSDSSVASVIFRDELETNIFALKQAAYMEGETAGLNSGEIAKDSILSIFSAPFYFLSNVLNFEILGINLYSIISFLITTAVVVFFFKKIKG